MPQPVLVVIDVQERLFDAMDAERRDDMVRNTKILGIAARRLGAPVMLSEQDPKGLGRTLPEIRGLLDGVAPVEQAAFSCCGMPGFIDRLRELEADPVVLLGLEAHAGVLLTALDLLGVGFRISVVADAVCSRTAANLEIGLAQARQAGAIITATETSCFSLSVAPTRMRSAISERC
jgi:nicotinamidase-related amidase